ncbi:similar to Saccharomyces cerevisiae YDR424C DYN2 Cytoplasmic light chain dynein, microtubule motor protein [Maudiozyma barnettii]|uniref:Dynein light chain n=1 Tax=Maudiozyma barnettii TaxID=61262 RepID=A0A8H2VDU5_9SACH|nr:dynein light chain [Kazachstania barnettii]CAB4253701.1 similar to Saccharomyces cerevisiae YDR424C DYN2 Cytoplasmic light chain dynein, microtubule motor protein [Kazachstania barnettii]CAD1781434.1 similar to Saccharomyces cerevisiae YDR424C DYN2 Cytoplasmic light chain dynein, microtubule motor protein [Kazachstania barnettii]
MSTESKQQEPVLKASDISDELKEDIFKISVDALNTCDLEREIAASIKHQLDSKYGNTWHVIVGKNFGSYVTHEKGNFIYFYIGPLAFLIFKTL